MRSMDIDFDIHKLIEAERRSFDEPPNDALRRLLGLPETKNSFASAEKNVATAVSTGNGAAVGDGLSWQAEGVVLPQGTKIRMTYGRPKKTYLGAIVNGEWIVDGQRFDSPSGAASGVAITGKGKKTRLNGWELWDVQRPGESGWTSIDKLRKQAAPRVKQEAKEFLKKLGL